MYDFYLTRYLDLVSFEKLTQLVNQNQSISILAIDLIGINTLKPEDFEKLKTKEKEVQYLFCVKGVPDIDIASTIIDKMCHRVLNT